MSEATRPRTAGAFDPGCSVCADFASGTTAMAIKQAISALSAISDASPASAEMLASVVILLQKAGSIVAIMSDHKLADDLARSSLPELAGKCLIQVRRADTPDPRIRSAGPRDRGSGPRDRRWARAAGP